MIVDKHTPGPWHVGGKDGTIIFDKDGWAIADSKSYHGHHAAGSAQANAHLIAAAPDLYDVAAELEDHLSRGAPDGPEGPAIRERLKAAINKARGEA